ncbi:ABC transporter permease [Dactylosporangium aurantiacum]|uniref:Transport permease protein n=1 Tax=Dactylosporangium aurantiacum TaxID=35754 RepID=A0A9Q9IMP8_9ACTN|nr:ABC transporter permease [Dactylosporangium aurantiacum]MDG6103283.1 ABC transporter permease [Dactylosporangium aurantiacum]UWZ57783.1 ABC transporter permease [Dactylosporangium aurantiacum]
MSTLTHAVANSATMLRRNLRHTLRYPSSMVTSLLIPVMLLLLFVGVFGGAIHAGMAGGGGYIDYVVPGILLVTVGYGASTTALAVNRDMTEGIIDRFRTMAITRGAVLTGHVLAATIRTMLSAALVIGVGLLMGFRPTGDPLRWLAATGVLLLLVLALTWLAVAIGLASPTPEGTTGFLLLVQVLPFVSSAFVTPESMSGPVRWFARNEPFTPIIDTLRGLLMDTPVGGRGLVAVAWCAGLAVAGYLWARAAFHRAPRP